MSRKIELYINDILESIDAIESYLENTTFEELKMIGKHIVLRLENTRSLEKQYQIS